MNKIDFSIFQFEDYTEYLNAIAKKYGRSHSSPYCLSAWAKRLGYQSPSSLTMILKKQRLPSVKMIQSLGKDLNLSLKESEYLFLLTDLERKKTKGRDVDTTIKKLNKIKNSHYYQKINLNSFSTVSHWYFLVIKQMTKLKNMPMTPEYISKKLRNKVSPAKVKEAVQIMLQSQFLAFKDGKIVDAKKDITAGDSLPSSSIRNHHRGMIHRSLEALEEQPVSFRYFQSLTLCFDKSKDYNQAINDVSLFVKEFNSKYGQNENGNSVYQLNMQFFEHTKEIVE